MNKRKVIVYIVSILVMTCVFISTFYIKLEDVTLYELLATFLFPFMLGRKACELATRFCDWLIQTNE